PLLFMTGLVGRMFREFALTLTIAVVISAVVSLTLTPMMCSRLLRHHPEGAAGWLSRLFNAVIEAVIEAYRLSLEWGLRHEQGTPMVPWARVVATIGFSVIVPRGFLPLQDPGAITAVMQAGPEVSFAEMERLQARAAAAISSDPDVASVISLVGVSNINPTPNSGQLKIALKPRDLRRSDVTAVMPRPKALVATIACRTLYLPPVQDLHT